MERLPMTLRAGYRRFREDRYHEQRALYERLAKGQQPKVAILACADSRADPALIFDAAPGELFVLRNVANLVPAFERGGTSHGTVAGLEFAVSHLAVDDIVVMGHASCGGIEACLRSASGEAGGYFVSHWVELAEAARDLVLAEQPALAGDALRHAVEQRSVLSSLERLQTFPFVAEAMRARGMRLHGAWFSIMSGELSWIDPPSGCFTTVAFS
ncbi:MAG: carbonic anhydrase [Pseudomonadota bacterium]